MKGSELFSFELNAILDSKLRDAVATFLDNEVPEYFYHVSASSTGKYHPAYTLGEGGLVRHTMAAVAIAITLLDLEQYRELHRDNIIAALILHDTFKHGEEDYGHTVFSHPLLAAEKWYNFAESYFGEDDCIATYEVSSFIASHMGEWNTMNGITLPKPNSESQKFVHLCDYLASRKFITVEV